MRDLLGVLLCLERLSIDKCELCRTTHPLEVVRILATVNINWQNLDFGLFGNGECAMFELHELRNVVTWHTENAEGCGSRLPDSDFCCECPQGK